MRIGLYLFAKKPGAREHVRFESEYSSDYVPGVGETIRWSDEIRMVVERKVIDVPANMVHLRMYPQEPDSFDRYSESLVQSGWQRIGGGKEDDNTGGR